MRRPVNNHEYRIHGLTLIEVATGLLVLGLLISGGIALYNQAQRQQQVLVTHEHMDEIVSALSLYAETSGRVPCPADPSAADITFGWERGVTLASGKLQVGAGAFPIGTCDSTNNEGIVPFLSLNLPDNIARDGWGRYFTYAVSPQFARSNDQSHNPDGTVNVPVAPAPPDVGTIHGRCRTQGWAGRYDNHNISAVKSRFCCSDQSKTPANIWNATTYTNATDLIIEFTDAGKTVISPQRDTNSNLPANYANNPANLGNTVYDTMTSTLLVTVANPTTPTGTTQLPAILSSAQSSALAPAIVLVSHGQNGAGAYLANGTNNRYKPPAAGSLEAINADGAAAGTTLQRRTFIDGPTSTGGGANYFDDIVRWMTQDSLIAAHGALSCQYP